MDKRTPKNPIHFQLDLNAEQLNAKNIILQNKITVLTGEPGCGKSLVACNVALEMFFRKEIDKIFIARPLVYAEKEPLGILPGDIRDKLIGITTPIIENMYNLYNKEKIDLLLKEDKIHILPLSFMRGLTVSRSLLIIDECQNAKLSQIYDCLTRLGKGSKIIVTGDMSQCDLPNPSESGFGFYEELVRNKLPNCSIINLEINHRDELVKMICKIYKNYKK